MANDFAKTHFRKSYLWRSAGISTSAIFKPSFQHQSDSAMSNAKDEGASGSKDDVKLKWMYDGPKSSVNREDYLLGKKVSQSQRS